MNQINNTLITETGLAPLSVLPLKMFHGNQDGHSTVPHRHQSFEIIWVTSGTGKLSIDLSTLDLTSGKAYCISPGQIHHLEVPDGTEGYIVSFTNEFISHEDACLHFMYRNGFLYASEAPNAISISCDVQPYMRETIGRMLKEMENYYLLRREVLLNLLKIFLLDLSRQLAKITTPKPLNPRNVDLVNRFLMLLDQHYGQRKPVQFYADELHVSPNYLNEIVKRVTASPASYHIQQRVIMEAKRQAMYQFCSMKEIAINLGFDDFAHFSRFFKKNAGVNFTAFKKAAIGNPVVEEVDAVERVLSSESTK
jgi:AraC family transcriptional regulator, transcriptional activator of pobA